MAERHRAPAWLPLALFVAGCHAAPDKTDNTTSAPTPTSSTVAVAVPQSAAGTAPPAALGGYAGHYPFDKIGGVRFLDQPAVIGAVNALTPDTTIRTLVLGGDGPAAPIAMRQGKLLAWGCETHNCGDHNWTVEIAPDGSEPAICYHDAATMQAQSRWYLAAGRAELRGGDCPSGG